MKIAKSKINITVKLLKAGNGAIEKKKNNKNKKRMKKDKPAKDPNKPKRPPTAFFVFMSEFRKLYKENHPDNKSVGVVSKAGSEKWKSMTESEKAPYVANAEKRKTEYTKLMEAYNNSSNKPDESKSEVTDDTNEGVEVESSQRRRLRLEREHRTVERVAKALEEKKLRDYLAQREQAERARLSERFDAKVTRWANGKEGNLRGLLSTLQCILGKDCGWEPIARKDVVSPVAVKIAYRKATLCVHPDKLQQRGASVQQKYICEKVFEVLKDAWNKFSC